MNHPTIFDMAQAVVQTLGPLASFAFGISLAISLTAYVVRRVRLLIEDDEQPKRKEKKLKGEAMFYKYEPIEAREHADYHVELGYDGEIIQVANKADSI